MLVPKYDHVKTITIWSPRYSTGHVLIAKHHISAQVPHYKIIFTKAKSLPGEYYLSYHTIVKSKRDSNGSVPCYAVKLEHLEDFEREEHSILEVI